jgi:hypothetical protein
MISIENARSFVHAHGVMWERALWDYLFDQGPVERVHQCLSCYKNEDGGWGHVGWSMTSNPRCPTR